MERIFASIKETGSTLGLGRSTIYRMINEGQLETIKVGSRRLVRIASIEAIAAGSQQKGKDALTT